MRTILAGFLTLIALLALSGSRVHAHEITFDNIVGVCDTCGKLAGPLNIIGPVVWGLDATGIRPSEERAFREKMLKQNEEVLSGVQMIGRDLTKVHEKLDEIQREIHQIPAHITARESFIHAHAAFSDACSLKSGDIAGREALRADLKAYFKHAKGTMAIDPADLHFAAASQLAVFAVCKLYQLEGGKIALKDKTKRDDFIAMTADLERLVTHCDDTAVFLTQHRKNEERYADLLGSIESTIDKNGLPPIYRSDSQEALTISLEQRVLKVSPAEEVRFGRLVLIRTKEETSEIVTVSGHYKLTVSEGRFLTNLPITDGTKLRVFKPIRLDDFESASSSQVRYDATKVVDVAPQEHLRSALKKYNALVEESLPIAYEVTLARGISSSNAKIKDILKRLRADCEKASR